MNILYRVFSVLMVALFSFVLSTISVFAGSVTLTGTVDSSDYQPFGSCNYLEHIPFTVTVSGDYISSNLLPVYTTQNLWVIWINEDPVNHYPNGIRAFSDGTNYPNTLTAGTVYYFHVMISCGTNANPTDYSFDFSGPGDICFTVCGAETRDPQPAFFDGRINNYDTAAPVAIFPHEVDGETGFVIYSSEGVELLLLSPELLANTPEFPETNLLIAEGNGVVLYRLTTGEWQLNAEQYNGKTYVIIFGQPYPNTGYRSFEID